MLLTVDIGNTSITFGVYKKDELVFRKGIYTDRNKTTDEYATSLSAILNSYKIRTADFKGAIISSVVPEITDFLTCAIEKIIGIKPLIVGEKYNGNFKVDILPVSYIGADLIAASIGATKKYPLPCLIADLGTATKILVIDKEGYFRGCTISPGVKISLEALSKNASLLPDISLEKPSKAIGENTVECMQSGIVLGTAAMLDGLIKRIKDELKQEVATVVATGGYSKSIVPCCETEIIYDENLLLEGLKEIYELGVESNKNS